MDTGADRIGGEPLRSYRLFHTQDVDEARAIVSRSFCPHKLDCLRGPESFEVVHNRSAGRMMSLNYLRYGAEVRIEPGELERFYLIQFPIRGRATVSSGRHEVACDPGRAAVLNPSLWSRLIWHAGCEKLLVQIDRQALNRLAQALIGHPLDQPVVFAPGIDLSQAAVAEWAGLLRTCFAAAERDPARWGEGGRHQAIIEEELMIRFLLCQPSVISHFLKLGLRPAPNTRQLRQARSFIHERLAEPITLGQIARAAGCSIRGLQLAFQSQYGCSPTQYLRQERLNLAHYMLKTTRRRTQVNQVVYDVGFAHPGRFSLAYKRAFGESPSATLNRAQDGLPH